MEPNDEKPDDEERVESDVKVAEEAACMPDVELSPEERLRDAYRLW